MLGCYDFCGHYEWTFEWLREQGGDALVREYWDQAIRCDSQTHASTLIEAKGFEGMREYWGHTLDHEAAGYAISESEQVFRIDMHVCPSKGFLMRNDLKQYSDYCDHCIGWIGPLMKKAGFVINHEHNHCGQCWWEMRRKDDASSPELTGPHDVRLRADWVEAEPLDHYHRATSPEDKI